MFDFKDAQLQIDSKFITDRLSEYDIFSRYCSNFKNINKSFCSELRTDKNPDCRIGYWNNKWIYKDFASGESYNCFYYIMKKYNCTYHESLNIIAGDFGLIGHKIDRKVPVMNDLTNKLKFTNKKIIDVYERNWEKYDQKVWHHFDLIKGYFDEFRVKPCKYVVLTKDNKRITFENRQTNPIYSYEFDNSYKIYIPFGVKHHRFLFNGTLKDVEGYDQLPLNGELLIITKSLKDCIYYKLLGFSAISLQGEHNPLDEDIFKVLNKRFDRIIVNLDNDFSGIEGAKKLCFKYGFKSFIIPLETGEKDLSDLIRKVSVIETKSIINKQLELCMKQ